MITLVETSLRAIGCWELSIREPEVWTDLERWTPERCFDGRHVDLAEATELLHSMLLAEGFWCRLESDSVALHVGEDLLYVGADRRLSMSLDDPEDVAVAVVSATASPYKIVRPTAHPYQIADSAYWEWLTIQLDRPTNRVLLLRQWAAGFGGEHWYLVTDEADVATVRGSPVPRSIYAIFPEGALLERAATGLEQLSTRLGDEVQFGNLRIMSRNAGDAMLQARSVSDWHDLWEAWASAAPDSLLLQWPTDDSSMRFAVDPDADGVVRTAALFD